MKIRSSLRITSTLALLMMVGSVVSTALAYRWLRQATELELFLIDLQGDIFERSQLRDEYLLTGRQPSFQRWEEKSAEIGRHLKSLSEVELSPANAILLARMNQKFKTTMELFPRIVALRASLSGGDPAGTPTSRIEQRLVHQVLVDAYLLSDSTKLLLFDVRNHTIDSRNKLLLLLVLSTLIMGLVVTSSAAYVNVLLSRRVSALKDGTTILSQGAFDHRIPASGDDELADLAREVNRMAEELKQSYGRLEAANKELEAFSYSVSHDLRAPLRHLTGFVELLDRLDSRGMDEKARHYLHVISGSAKKMGCLIDDLLSFSRMSRGEMMKQSVDLQQLAHEVIKDIAKGLPPQRTVRWRIGELPVVTGDHAMLRLVLVNLVANAVKYSNNVEAPVIEVNSLSGEKGCFTLYVKDNGAGFDMKYVDKLFGLFQRLHSSEEYEGTGVGLANVRRIIGRHGGKTWAEGELNRGATFYFTLPNEKET